MLPKVELPHHMTSDFTKKVQSIGKDGYDYQKTEDGLKRATRKMLENSKKLKKKPTGN